MEAKDKSLFTLDETVRSQLVVDQEAVPPSVHRSLKTSHTKKRKKQAWLQVPINIDEDNVCDYSPKQCHTIAKYLSNLNILQFIVGNMHADYYEVILQYS